MREPDMLSDIAPTTHHAARTSCKFRYGIVCSAGDGKNKSWLGADRATNRMSGTRLPFSAQLNRRTDFDSAGLGAQSQWLRAVGYGRIFLCVALGASELSSRFEDGIVWGPRVSGMWVMELWRHATFLCWCAELFTVIGYRLLVDTALVVLGRRGSN